VPAQEWRKVHTELSANVLTHFPFHSTLCKTLTAQEVSQRPRRALTRKRDTKAIEKTEKPTLREGRSPGDSGGWKSTKYRLQFMRGHRYKGLATRSQKREGRGGC